MIIDITYDFRKDIKPNQDPDKYSKKLRSYHKELWSKILPSGEKFNLSDTQPNKYLYHKSSLGKFSLSSDGIGVTLLNRKSMNSIINQIKEEEKEKILEIMYSIGGFIIFPSDRVLINGKSKMTINGERGINQKITDRFDLTLECIRRYYLNIKSPLSETLNRYKDFFSLFKNFEGYVEFFLLQDLVNSDFTKIKFFLPFDETFPLKPLPKNIEDYNIYIENNLQFIINRGNRMKK